MKRLMIALLMLAALFGTPATEAHARYWSFYNTSYGWGPRGVWNNSFDYWSYSYRWGTAWTAPVENYNVFVDNFSWGYNPITLKHGRIFTDYEGRIWDRIPAAITPGYDYIGRNAYGYQRMCMSVEWNGTQLVGTCDCGDTWVCRSKYLTYSYR